VQSIVITGRATAATQQAILRFVVRRPTDLRISVKFGPPPCQISRWEQWLF